MTTGRINQVASPSLRAGPFPPLELGTSRPPASPLGSCWTGRGRPPAVDPLDPGVCSHCRDPPANLLGRAGPLPLLRCTGTTPSGQPARPQGVLTLPSPRPPARPSIPFQSGLLPPAVRPAKVRLDSPPSGGSFLPASAYQRSDLRVWRRGPFWGLELTYPRRQPTG